MKKVNKIDQHNTLNINDVRWYSSIKNKIESLDSGYGTISVVLKVKSSKIVGIEYITKENENIG